MDKKELLLHITKLLDDDSCIFSYYTKKPKCNITLKFEGYTVEITNVIYYYCGENKSYKKDWHEIKKIWDKLILNKFSIKIFIEKDYYNIYNFDFHRFKNSNFYFKFLKIKNRLHKKEKDFWEKMKTTDNDGQREYVDDSITKFDTTLKQQTNKYFRKEKLNKIGIDL